ncbi:hypothetical protein L226DRAFT_608111 [Lentinus tigrinus ALCF2SS1-7]|uniref:F-box domain-containing protein n=1 Tax=Lentinus tigrinus ALCF2SS1-6 TaxID=1328759 RepID=A0A5C2ST32_9APHY|nr:hypothetical protein L227DRAFT_647992 [Lentinus tigrinus ALCF2SS1-6]RPD80765.1 hypothetical protein L226DRAFT_608111 [Lentinus tigrinus ALCF2SS1-7]
MAAPPQGIDRLPNEIWQEIIWRACTDNGRTGRALALSCRFFHDQSLNLRFNSLSLPRTKKVVRLLDALNRQPPDCKPRIQHLLITPDVYSGAIPKSQYHLLGDRRRRQVTDRIDFSANAVNALFSIAAKHLRTLCLYPNVSGEFTPFRPFTVALPVLEELTVWRHPLTSSFTAVPTSIHCSMPSDNVPFPSLKRFHAVLADIGHLGAQNILHSLCELSGTGLTHLRLSGITYLDGELPKTLAEMLGLPIPRTLTERMRSAGTTARDSSGPVIPTAARFPKLRHVVIYAIQPSRLSDDPSAFTQWANLLSRLRDLERTCNQVPGMRMVMLERSWMRKPRWDQRLKKDWHERMDGDVGCWVTSDKEELGIEGPPERPKAVSVEYID